MYITKQFVKKQCHLQPRDSFKIIKAFPKGRLVIFEAKFRLLFELFVDGPDGLLEIVQFHADDHVVLGGAEVDDLEVDAALA